VAGPTITRPRLLLVLGLLAPTLGCGGWFAEPCTGGIDDRTPCTTRHTFETCTPSLIRPQWTWQEQRCPDDQVCADVDDHSLCVDELIPGGCPAPSRYCEGDVLHLCKTARTGQGYWRTSGCRHGCGELPEWAAGCLPAP
jgi:hypothetical protein